MALVPTVGILTTLRAGWRLFLLGLHLLLGVIVVRMLFPFLEERRRNRIKQLWARIMLRTLGVRLHASAIVLPKPALIVCNHVSWLDIFVIDALTPTHFVCKDEVRGWPLIGWLVAATGNVYIERGSRAAASQTMQVLLDRLGKGERISFFPEGTTTDGTTLLPFRTALFEAASRGAAPVVTMSLRYLDRDGRQSLAPAYDGEVTFMECLLAIVRAPAIIAELNPIATLAPGLERREYARHAQHGIALALGLNAPPAEP